MRGVEVQALNERAPPWGIDGGGTDYPAPAPEFTEEMCNLLGIDVLVDLHVGAGWKGCAALSRNIRAILVPNNKAHKDWVIKNLVEFVQKRNLVTFNAKAKPKELTAWEVVTNINIESISV